MCTRKGWLFACSYPSMRVVVEFEIHGEREDKCDQKLTSHHMNSTASTSISISIKTIGNDNHPINIYAADHERRTVYDIPRIRRDREDEITSC